MSTYTYYPGCTLHSTAREYDVSARLVCRAIGIRLEELADWSCCGASSAHSMNRALGIELPALTLKSARQKGAPLAVACAMCFWRLKMVAHELASSGHTHPTKEKPPDTAGHPVEILHLVQILEARKGSMEIKRQLKGLRVSCYYGCLLVRPHEVLQLDDDENPTIMDKLIGCTGAEVLDWSAKTECCGASLTLARPDIVLKMSHHVLLQAKGAKADCLAVACPMCHSNLDMMQKQIGEKFGHDVNMPVLYFTQLLGLALGFSAEELLLDRHQVDPLPLLRAKGLK